MGKKAWRKGVRARGGTESKGEKRIWVSRFSRGEGGEGLFIEGTSREGDKPEPPRLGGNATGETNPGRIKIDPDGPH